MKAALKVVDVLLRTHGELTDHFVNGGGIELILSASGGASGEQGLSPSPYSGASSLVTTVLRRVLEDDSTTQVDISQITRGIFSINMLTTARSPIV